MQTEIDQFLTKQNALLSQQNKLLAEQNGLLSQQIDSLQTILSSYNELEQSLNNKIHSLETENETMKKLISAMKLELLKLEQGKFSEQLQQAFQENLRTQLQMQLTTALNQLNLKTTVRDLVKIELQPIQQTIGTQQTDLEAALSTILQLQVPTDFYTDLEMQIKQINTLGETVERLMTLINNLNN